jgi:uncharacterized protein YkwD
MKIKKTLICLALCFSFMTVLAAISGKFTARAAGDYETKVLELVNEQRAAYGLPELQWSDDAYEAAKIRAKEVITSFSHTRPNGTYFSTVFDEVGISYAYAAENIAYGYNTPQEVVNAWMDSPGHKANILSGKVTYLGVAMTTGSGNSPSWVQEFYTPSGYSFVTTTPTPTPETPKASEPSALSDNNQNGNWWCSVAEPAYTYGESYKSYVSSPQYQPPEWNTNLQSYVPDEWLTVWFDTPPTQTCYRSN